MKIQIKDSRVYNIDNLKDLVLAEKTKNKYNNLFNKVETIVVGIDKVIIRGLNLIK